MAKLFLRLSILSLILNINAFGKDLGSYGETKEIIEEDLLIYFEKKINSITQDELQMHQKKIQDKVIKQIKRPKPVTGITKALENRIRFYDPTFTVEEDITDHLGNIIHSLGARINPLEKVSFLEEWIFIDGDDMAQVEFAKVNMKVNTKIILINGSPGMQEDGSYYYFDQFGEICKKIGITKVPSVVKQKGDLIEIHEITLYN
jgi:conjugal transfer pilus assembly protein TraW